VNGCTQAFHRTAWTPLENGGKIVDMTGAIALLATAAALVSPSRAADSPQLPSLPVRGLARQLRAGVELEMMKGRRLALLTGLELAPDKVTGHELVMRDRLGRLFTLDPGARRVRRVYERPRRFAGCRLADARFRLELLVCGRTVKAARYRPGAKPLLRVVAAAPGRVGHWERAAFALTGKAFFAQWSAECEVPVAFLVTGTKMHPYGGKTLDDAPSSVALGWLPDGSALVHFPKGACGGTFRLPGIYAVPLTGAPRLILRTPYFASYLMWGG
jgi:hypothetical protein